MNSSNLLKGEAAAEFTDNKGLEHVNKYARLDDTIRVPCEQQQLEEKPCEDDEFFIESDVDFPIDLPNWDISDHITNIPSDWRPENEPKPWRPRKPKWISLWFDPRGSRIEIEEKIREHIRDVTKATQQKVSIQVAGYCGKDTNPGYGAFICDYRLKPLVAESQVLSVEEFVSPAYHELQGVNLGLKLAIEFNVLHFRFYCSSYQVARFLRDCLLYNNICTCMENSGSGSHCTKMIECDVCIKSIMPFDKKAYLLPVVKSIIASVSELECRGLPYDCYALADFDRDENRVAEYLAKLGESRRMYPRDIRDSRRLTDLIYADADLFHRTYGLTPET